MRANVFKNTHVTKQYITSMRLFQPIAYSIAKLLIQYRILERTTLYNYKMGTLCLLKEVIIEDMIRLYLLYIFSNKLFQLRNPDPL